MNTHALGDSYKQGLEVGVKLKGLEVATRMILMRDSDDLIRKAVEITIEELELLKIAIRMFLSAESIEFVTKYTKFNKEMAETIRDCIQNHV